MNTDHRSNQSQPIYHLLLLGALAWHDLHPPSIREIISWTERLLTGESVEIVDLDLDLDLILTTLPVDFVLTLDGEPDLYLKTSL